MGNESPRFCQLLPFFCKQKGEIGPQVQAEMRCQFVLFVSQNPLILILEGELFGTFEANEDVFPIRVKNRSQMKSDPKRSTFRFHLA